MADVITRFRLETTQYDSKLRDAAKGLKEVVRVAELGGKDFKNFSDKAIENARALGQTASGATNAKDRLKELVGSFNEAAKAYNNLSQTQQQSDFGKALSQSLEQLQQRIKQTKDELYGLGDAVSSKGGGLFSGDKLSGMLQVFGGNLMTKGAGMAVGFASELGDMVKQGIELAKQGEGIRIAFERLGRGDILQGLREATHGTVTDLELMKAAVQFNDFKLPVEELGTMLAFAQQKAKDTGQSVEYMTQSIVTGLGRKSLMILDNLGLSAAEIKERMAETGDMTKAVGAIIREQMAKAGDYVETAADRATQANVELENAMTRLGETFQPLSDSANSMWTDIKVGALDLLNNAIRPLIDAFTEAGRARALYESQGGDARVNRQLDRLKGIQTDSYRKGTYKAQLRNYDTQIASHEQYLKDYKTWQSDKTNVGAYDRMQAFQKQTGMKWVSDVQAHLDAFKKMRSEYVQGAKSILAANPAPSPTSTTTTTTTGGASGNTFDASKIAFTGGEGFKADPNANFRSVWGMLGDEGLRQMMGIGAQQFDIKRVLDEYVNDPDKEKREKANKTKDPMTELSKAINGLTSIRGGLEGMGIKLPAELEKGLNVLQGLMSIIQGVQAVISIFSTSTETANTIAVAANTVALGTLTAAVTANTATNFLPFAKGGVVHAANGYVDGNTFSGDQIPIMVNSGELILNRAQQGAIASQLSDSGNQRPSSSPYVTGEIIYLGLTNYLKSTGRGEIMTSRFKQ